MPLSPPPSVRQVTRFVTPLLSLLASGAAQAASDLPELDGALDSAGQLFTGNAIPIVIIALACAVIGYIATRSIGVVIIALAAGFILGNLDGLATWVTGLGGGGIRL